MTKTNEIVAIVEAEPPQKQQPSPFPAPFPNLFSFFPKFNIQLPFLPPKPKPNHPGDSKTVASKQQNEESSSSKRSLVRFPKSQGVASAPPLQAEADPESSTKTSNPFILWQVYALGGIIISRWIWARWNERQAGGKPPNDDRNEGRPSDDGGSPSLDNNE